MTTETSATAFTPATFTRMDESTAEQWAVIGHETMDALPDVAEHVLALLRNLDGMVLGFAVDQLTHCLQTATLAERAGADDELVVASLCHDVGKYVSVANHPAIAAEMLRPFVRANDLLRASAGPRCVRSIRSDRPAARRCRP